MKEQTTMKLTGVDTFNNPVKLGKDVECFIDRVSKVSVCITSDTAVTLQTSKDVYILTKHKTLNIYQGVCNGVKVHFSMKKITAKLTYWA